MKHEIVLDRKDINEILMTYLESKGYILESFELEPDTDELGRWNDFFIRVKIEK